MNDLQTARNQVLLQIQHACQHAKRSETEVQLLAVSKTQESACLRQMYEAGQRSFGENYLQEALTKIDEL